MNYGQILIPGRSKKEILISTYICHPNLANDNLSGVVLTTILAYYLSNKNLNYTYRIIFIPETIQQIQKQLTEKRLTLGHDKSQCDVQGPHEILLEVSIKDCSKEFTGLI